MNDGHSARAHATWSASASARLWACPGSLALSAGARDKENRAAAWGTACHEVAELALREGRDAVEFLGRSVVTKSHQIEVDEEVCDTAQVHVDYVLERKATYADETGDEATLLLEQRFDLASIHPPFDAGGTGDAVLLFPRWGLVEIVDLKSGMGLVEAEGNKQLRTYALGALLANPGPWTHVRSTIVQPRAPHPDGRIRHEELHVADLLDWTSDLVVAMWRAAQACADVEKAPLAEFAEQHLFAGDHCQYCPARLGCPALERKALATAETFFQPQTGALATPPDPRSLPLDKVAAILDAADMLTGWLNSVRSHAMDLAEMGVDVPGYVLVPKRAIRKWRDEAAAAAALHEEGHEDVYAEPKLLSPAQVEKKLGKKGYAEISHLVVQESSGLNLVRGDKTTRGAVPAPVTQMFQPITED